MLDIIPALLLVTGVVFLVLMILLNKTLYKPLISFMEHREKSIKKDMENAGKNSDEVEAFKQEAQEIILRAKTEANKIKESALVLAKDEAMKRYEAKKSELEEQYSQFLQKLDAQRVELKETLRKELPLFRSSVKTKLDQI